MVVRTLYVVRHADRPWNLVGVDTPTGIPGDVALSAHGVDQARELTWFCSAPFSDDSRPTPDAIYTSCYWRTLQTIGALPCRTDRLFVEPGLGERVLDDGYHPPIELSPAQQAAFARIDPDYVPVHVPPPTRESRRDLVERMATVVDRLLKRIETEQPDVETVLLGTHASPAICLARALLGTEAAHVHTYTAGITKYVRRDRRGRLGAWRLDWNCRTDFLSGGAEKDWRWGLDTATGVEAAAAHRPRTSSTHRSPPRKRTTSGRSLHRPPAELAA